MAITMAVTTVRRLCIRTAGMRPAQATAYSKCTFLLHLVLTLWALDTTTTTTTGHTVALARRTGDGADLSLTANERILTRILMFIVGYRYRKWLRRSWWCVLSISPHSAHLAHVVCHYSTSCSHCLAPSFQFLVQLSPASTLSATTRVQRLPTATGLLSTSLDIWAAHAPLLRAVAYSRVQVQVRQELVGLHGLLEEEEVC